MSNLLYKKSELIEALKESNGFWSGAAKILGCDVRTIANYIKRFPELKDVIKEQKHRRDDNAEVLIQRRIREGSDTMLIFYAKTQMRDRGQGGLPAHDSDVVDNELIIKHEFCQNDETDLSI